MGTAVTPGRAPRRMTADDDWEALQRIKAWLAEHPECTDPEIAVKALGLSVMDGVPADPKARTSAQQHHAKLARDMLQHAAYAIRDRDDPPLTRRTEGSQR
jgi:hypothetical protein